MNIFLIDVAETTKVSVPVVEQVADPNVAKPGAGQSIVSVNALPETEPLSVQGTSTRSLNVPPMVDPFCVSVATVGLGGTSLVPDVPDQFPARLRVSVLDGSVEELHPSMPRLSASARTIPDALTFLSTLLRRNFITEHQETLAR